MSPFMVFGLFLAVFAVIVVIVIQRAPAMIAAAEAKLIESWTPYATSRDFTVVAGEGPWYQRSPVRMRGDVEDVGITIDTYTVSSQDADGTNRSKTYTRLVANAAEPLAAKVSLYREHAFSGIGKLLGFQDVETGDVAFDREYVVKADVEGAARELLDARSRNALVALPEGVTTTYKYGALEMSWLGVETKAEVFDPVIEVAVALCCARA